MLPSWANTPTRATIDDVDDVVDRVTNGPDAVSGAERVAAFDNDGTLLTEKPLVAQLAYLVEQWRKQAEADPALAEKQPYRAVVSGDFGWPADAVAKRDDIPDDAGAEQVLADAAERGHTVVSVKQDRIRVFPGLTG